MLRIMLRFSFSCNSIMHNIIHTGKQMKSLNVNILALTIAALSGCSTQPLKPPEVTGTYREINHPGYAFIDDIRRSGGATGNVDIFKKGVTNDKR